MIKILIQIILTIVLGFFAQQYFPFWSMAAVAGLVALFFSYRSGTASFIAGFIGAALLWYAYAFTLNIENSGLLAGKMGTLFQLKGNYLMLVSGLMGGMLGGFGALTGSMVIQLFKK